MLIVVGIPNRITKGPIGVSVILRYCCACLSAVFSILSPVHALFPGLQFPFPSVFRTILKIIFIIGIILLPGRHFCKSKAPCYPILAPCIPILTEKRIGYLPILIAISTMSAIKGFNESLSIMFFS